MEQYITYFGVHPTSKDMAQMRFSFPNGQYVSVIKKRNDSRYELAINYDHVYAKLTAREVVSILHVVHDA